MWKTAHDARPKYLNAATCGLPTTATTTALCDEVSRWQAGHSTAENFAHLVEESRALYANLVRVCTDDVAIGATTAALVALVAGSLPPGSQVLGVEQDFSSLLAPFSALAARGITLRLVPLEELAMRINDQTSLVAFSLIQSIDGRVADESAIQAAAARAGALTLCDTTQAAGVYPVDASRYDFTVCHSYKWLCVPRGAAFLTVAPERLDELQPLQANWCAGANPWDNTYGHDIDFAPSARRFDTSPAWHSWLGAHAALQVFRPEDIPDIWQHATGCADALLTALDMPPRGQAIISLDDPDGRRQQRLSAAGYAVSSRAGRLRLSFHVWNRPAQTSEIASLIQTVRHS